MKIKTLLVTCLLPLSATISATAQAPQPAAVSAPAPADSAVVWNSSLTAALQRAKATQKPVLAVFSGSDWCKPCIMLKQEVLDQPAFTQYAKDNLVLARFDFPRSKKNKLAPNQTQINEQAAAQLNKEGSFPLVVLLSPDGKVLAKTGYRAGGAAAYTTYLQSIMPKQP